MCRLNDEEVRICRKIGGAVAATGKTQAEIAQALGFKGRSRVSQIVAGDHTSSFARCALDLRKLLQHGPTTPLPIVTEFMAILNEADGGSLDLAERLDLLDQALWVENRVEAEENAATDRYLRARISKRGVFASGRSTRGADASVRHPTVGDRDVHGRPDLREQKCPGPALRAGTGALSDTGRIPICKT